MRGTEYKLYDIGFKSNSTNIELPDWNECEVSLSSYFEKSIEKTQEESPIFPIRTEAIKYQLNHTLTQIQSLEDVIERSTLAWEDEEHTKSSKATIERVSMFLSDYSVFILRKYLKVLPVPSIGACRDGSIDLFWDHENFYFLINIENSAPWEGRFIGKPKSKSNTLKGECVTDTIQDYIANWIVSNLS